MFADRVRVRNSRRMIALAGAAVLSAACSQTLADSPPYGLFFDLRLPDGSKTAQVNNVGDVVTMDLWAYVTGQNAELDDTQFLSSMGYFLSSATGLRGDLTCDNPPSAVRAAGSTIGVQRDLDGDGDLDIGGSVFADAGDFYVVRAGSPVTVGSKGLRLGRVRFAVTDASPGTTQIQYLARAQGQGALWVVNGTTYDGSSSLVNYGSPVTISYRGSVEPPPEILRLSGEITQHLSVRGTVRAAPGATLTITSGLDVWRTGNFDMRDERGLYSASEIRIDDFISGNVGGTIRAGAMHVGCQSGGSFTQGGGLTQIGMQDAQRGEVVIGACPASRGFLGISGGTFMADSVRVVNGYLGTNPNGRLLVGDLAVGSMGEFRVTGGQLTVTGNAVMLPDSIVRFSEPGVASFARLTVTTTRSESFYNAAAILGGSVSAQFACIGDSEKGAVRQAGGRAQFTTLSIGDKSTGESNYALASGELRVGNLMVGEPNRGRFSQSGGTNSIDNLHIAPRSEFAYSGGTLRINQSLELRGTFDFCNAPVTLALADNALADFSRGTILNSSSAAIAAGKGSLMTFPAGFDPYAKFASIQTEGLIHFAGEELVIPPAKDVSGSGTIQGDVVNQGTLDPGPTPGQIAIDGGFQQDTSGELHIQIDGSNADQRDLVSISDTAKLDGVLKVDVALDYTPSYGEIIPIITADSIQGVFANGSQRLITDRGSFDVLYTANSVALTHFVPIPEPSGAIFLLLSLLMTRRLRRKVIG